MTAIEVTTRTKINHWELGKETAEWNSTEQGEFLHGMAAGFSDLKGAGHLQINYVVQSIPEQQLREVRRFVELLAEYFKDET